MNRNRRPKGKSETARRSFGLPPRDCPKCGGNGMVIDTRVTQGSVTRRRRCQRNHRWTSSEVYVAGSRKGVYSIDVMNADFKRGIIDSLIAELKGMRR